MAQAISYSFQLFKPVRASRLLCINISARSLQGHVSGIGFTRKDIFSPLQSGRNGILGKSKPAGTPGVSWNLIALRSDVVNQLPTSIYVYSL